MHKLLIGVLIISPIRNTKLDCICVSLKCQELVKYLKITLHCPVVAAWLNIWYQPNHSEASLSTSQRMEPQDGTVACSICPLRRHDLVGYAVNGNKSATHHTRYKIRILLYHVNYASLKEAWDSKPTTAKSCLYYPSHLHKVYLPALLFYGGTILGILDG
jgi:hypothetical protein